MIPSLSKMVNMNAFKRIFSNEGIDEIKTFVRDNVDLEKDSLYIATYKGKEIFQTPLEFIRKNKINRYIDFSGKVSKVAFCAGFYSESDEPTLSFVWLISGKKLPQEVKDSIMFDDFTFEMLEKDDQRIWEHWYPPELSEKYIFK